MTAYLWVMAIVFTLATCGAFIHVGEGGKGPTSKEMCTMEAFVNLVIAIWTIVLLAGQG